jgi:hypothetical protein
MQKSEYYLGNSLLKRSNVKRNWSEEEITEVIKCREDPLYFIENYFKIVSIDAGKVLFKLFPYQKEIIKTCIENNFTIIKIHRQAGKCVNEDINITVRNKLTGDIYETNIGTFFRERFGDSRGEEIV